MALVLAGFVLTGCTSAATPSDPLTTVSVSSVVTASVSASVSSAPSSVSVSVSVPSSAVSASSAPSSVGPLTMDAGTAAWFSAVCAGQKELESLAGPDTAGTILQIQAQVAAAYLALSGSASKTAGALSALQAPNLTGGSTIKQIRVAAFRAIATGYGQGAAAITAAKVTTTAALKVVIDKVEKAVQAAVAKVVAGAPEYPAGYAAAITALPACAGLS